MPPKDAETEVMERDKLVLDLVSERFKVEWDLGSELDGKASSLAGFVGIIISLQVGFGTILIDKIPKTNPYHVYLYLFYFLGIIFLICSILFAFRAYYLKEYSVAPNPEKLIEMAEKGESQNGIVRKISVDMKIATFNNEQVNNSKASNIIRGFIFLVLGIATMLMFAFSVIFSVGF
ncbi:hypothetical protein [Methanobacterium sp.]|uniref:hypothetical protein n=1 Tax=Methanobacterium sp. TaxID=2164 RepID=UPI002AB9773B|nr:hypothetical protein [Methanobacterium sp.]MDY9923684.1 hypothetical protein [Methanobacterium sp.]